MRRFLCAMALPVSVGLAVSATGLAAQVAEPASIPTVLAEVLSFPLSEVMGARPQYVVGRTPAGWPKSLVTPPSATLVGGVKFGPMMDVVYRVPRRVDVIQLYQRVLTDAGYTRHEVRPDSRGGFTSREPSMTTAWCSASGTANVTVFDSTSTTRSVVVSVVSPPMTSPACMSPEPPNGRMKPPLEIPTLTAPLGVTASADGTGWSGDNIRTSVRVDTTVSADSLLGHYAAQLRAAGWQLGKRLSDGTNALQPLSVRDTSGKRWVGAMTLVTAADWRSVTLNMMSATREQ